MNILNIEHISKIYGEKVIFDDVSLGIHSGDKIGVIGVNGTGKTTLLKIIAKINEPDKGQIICGNGIRVSYLPQNPEFPKKQSILEYVMDGKEHQDWKTESEAKTILTKLGIYDFDEGCDHLSGGQKKRVALARTLVDPTEVLILDEPTNHLDNDMVLWLEEFLNSFRGVLIMVTHDRYFLDRVTNKIVEIDKGKLYEYDTNYSGFVELKVQREEMELATERKRQSLLRVEMEWMKQGIKARGTRQRARTERFEELKNAKGPAMQQNVEMDSISSRLGKTTIELEHISKGFGDKQLINDFSYIVLRDDRIGFIGPNGCGKSTLIRIIDGMVEPDSGTVEIGETIKIGYFAQNQAQLLNENLTVFDTIDYVAQGDIRLKIRDILGAFMFGGEASDKKVKVLSGGERTRLAMIRLLLEPVNLLILDEPTNHLDMRSKDVLKDALREFDGTVIVVSHDREFLDGLVDKVYEFGNQKVVEHLGGIYNFLEHKKMDSLRELERSTGTSTSMSGTGEAQVSHNKLSYEARKELSKVIKKAEKAVAEAEARISELENGIAVIEAKLATPEGASDASLYGEYSALKKELSDAMDLWTERTMELEELNTQDS